MIDCKTEVPAAKQALKEKGFSDAFLPAGFGGNSYLQEKIQKLIDDTALSQNGFLIAKSMYANAKLAKDSTNDIAKGDYANRIFEAAETMHVSASGEVEAVRQKALEISLITQVLFCEKIAAYEKERASQESVKKDLERMNDEDAKKDSKVMIWIVGGIVGVIILAGLLRYSLRGK